MRRLPAPLRIFIIGNYERKVQQETKWDKRNYSCSLRGYGRWPNFWFRDQITAHATMAHLYQGYGDSLSINITQKIGLKMRKRDVSEPLDISRTFEAGVSVQASLPKSLLVCTLANLAKMPEKNPIPEWRQVAYCVMTTLVLENQWRRDRAHSSSLWPFNSERNWRRWFWNLDSRDCPMRILSECCNCKGLRADSRLVDLHINCVTVTRGLIKWCSKKKIRA